MTPTLADLCQTPALPPLPPFIETLVGSYADRDPGDETLINLVAQHPDWAVCARALAAALVGESAPLGLDEAMQSLGARQLRNLLLLAALPDLLPASGLAQLPGFWRYTVGTACEARWLARAVEEDGDDAFTLGMLHAVGLPLMYAIWPGPMAELEAAAGMTDPFAPARVHPEQKRLGLDHAQASAALAQHWGFPEPLSGPLAWVPSPLDALRWATPAAIVHVAAWRVRVELQGWSDAQAQASCPVEMGRVLGVPFAWDPRHATLTSASDELMGDMPAPTALARGLLAVLEERLATVRA